MVSVFYLREVEGFSYFKLVFSLNLSLNSRVLSFKCGTENGNLFLRFNRVSGRRENFFVVVRGIYKTLTKSGLIDDVIHKRGRNKPRLVFGESFTSGHVTYIYHVLCELNYRLPCANLDN